MNLMFGQWTIFGSFKLNKSFLFIDCWTFFWLLVLSIFNCWLPFLSLTWPNRSSWWTSLCILLCLISFESIWITFDLSSDSVVILWHFSVCQPNLTKDFTYLSQTFNFTYIVSIAIKKFKSNFLNLCLFFLIVRRIVDTVSVGQSVMHS